MDSKQKIIQSATVLFHTNGIYKTSVDSILKKSNVTKSNFYYHFRSKKSLVYKVLDKIIKSFESDILKKTIENRALKPLDRINNLYKYLSYLQKSMDLKNGSPIGNIALEMSDRDGHIRQMLSTFFLSQQSSIENCIREGIKTGSIKPEINSLALSELIVAHIEGSIMMVRTHKNISALENGRKTIIDLIKM